MKKILLLTTCLLGGLVAADLSNLPTDPDQEGAVALPSMPSSVPGNDQTECAVSYQITTAGLEISTAAATALLEVSAPSAGDKGDRKRRMSTESDLRDRGDRKKRAAPVECTIEEAEALAEWFPKSHLGNWGGSFYGNYYRIEYKEIQNCKHYVLYLRPTDPEISCEWEGRPATTFEVVSGDALPKDMFQLLYDLQRRYLKQDMVSQMTDAAFQRAGIFPGIFPGLTFFNMVLSDKIKKNHNELDRARKLLPTPYDAEFMQPAMPSDIRSYSFFRAVSLYKATYTSEISSFWLSYLSTAIRDLQPFYNAEASDSEILTKHNAFIKSLLVNLFDHH